jgi:LuxR family transcriptional regulator, maltose regulon positive regulatory protein
MSAIQLLLEDALLAAAPLGLRRPFLVEAAGQRALLGQRIEAGTAVAAFAVDLLRRMSGQHDRPPAAPASLVKALTEREQTHQRMVYRELGADGRREAVRRAKLLRLL